MIRIEAVLLKCERSAGGVVKLTGMSLLYECVSWTMPTWGSSECALSVSNPYPAPLPARKAHPDIKVPVASARFLFPAGLAAAKDSHD